MIFDITNMDEMIRSYIVSVLSEHYPNLDTSKNSAFDDVFIKTTIEILRPFIDAFSRMEIKSNLNNAEYMTVEELDEKGEGNYFISRNTGERASTILTLSFANLNINNPELLIKVPSGAIFSTTSGLEFQCEQEVMLTGEDLLKLYNKNKMTYELDIPVYATEIGSKYNVAAGEIIVSNTSFSNYLVGVVNKAGVTSGLDSEDNVTYAKRIREFFTSRQLGTAPGYRSFIMEAFNEVTDLYVSGYKDKYMTRDLLDIYDKETKSIITKHVGGMVDIYLKGCKFENIEANVTLNSNFMLINCKPDELVFPENGDIYDSVKVYNLTDSSKTPVVKSIEEVSPDFMNGKHSQQTKIVLDNENNQSFDPEIKNDMKVVFTKIKTDDGANDDNEGEQEEEIPDDYTYSIKTNKDIVTEEMYFVVGVTKTDLDAPVSSINNIKITESSEELSNLENRYQLVRNGEIGTSDETAYMEIINSDDYPNGYELTIDYLINETIRNVDFSLNEDYNRIITADLLIKEAEAIPVNAQFSVKISNKYKLADADYIRAKIKSSVIAFFDNYMMGDRVDQSDLVGWLYTDKSISDAIDYIALPFDVFYIPNNINEEIPTDGTQLAEDGVLPIDAIQYPVLNAQKFKINIIV